MKNSGSNIKNFLIFWEVEIPKKILHISGNGNPKKLLLFWKMELFSPSSKNKKIHSEIIYYALISLHSQKNCLIFQETKAPKKFVIFSQKKAFLIFWEMEPRKNSLCLRKWSFLILKEVTFQETDIAGFSNSKLQKILFFVRTP